MKRIGLLVCLITVFVSSSGFTFPDFDSSSATLNNKYYPLQVGDWNRFIGFGNSIGESELFIVIGTEEVDSVNCLKAIAEDVILWIAQDTDGNVWLVKVLSTEDNTTYTIGQEIIGPWVLTAPEVGDEIITFETSDPENNSRIVTQTGIEVSLGTGLGPYQNCIEVTEYADSEIEMIRYNCDGIGEVKRVEPQESLETRKELSEFGNLKPDPTPVFDSNSAIITNRLFPIKEGDWRKYVGYGDISGETETWTVVGTDVVDSVKCLQLKVSDATVWIAQDTDENVWFAKLLMEESDITLSIGSGISKPAVLVTPKVGDRISSIFPESGGTYGEVTKVGIDVSLSTGLGPFDNCIEVTNYYDYEVEEISYVCPEIGEVKRIETAENPDTRMELSELGNNASDPDPAPSPDGDGGGGGGGGGCFLMVTNQL